MLDHQKVWFNGEMIPWKSATVPILSHGLSRGSAIFEVFNIHPGPDGAYAFRMDRHLDRLFRSAELLGMQPGWNREQIAAGVKQAVQTNGIGRGLIKLMAFWGEEAVIQLVLDSKLDVAICTIPAFDGLGLDRGEPIAVCFSKWRKIRSDMVPADAKACANYLNGYLARKDAMDRGYDLGVLLTEDDEVGEGSIESVFMVKDGVLKTAPLGNILNSISRMSILQAAPTYGIQVSEERISRQMLLDADEIFTAHSGIRALPVKRIENRDLSPAPGPLTARVMEMMDAVCGMRDERFKEWFQPMF